MKIFYYSVFFILATQAVANEKIRVVDDEAQVIELLKPAKRVVSLAPHVTELLFAAGATNQIVGTVSYSDYPSAAKKVPLVGSYNRIDIENILSKKPDLIIAWSSGNSTDDIHKLKSLGLKVFVSEPKSFADVAENIRSMGRLMATEKAAQSVVSKFLADLKKLKEDFPNNKPVRVFYQVWNDPLMTISDAHLIGKIISFCRGENVFGDLSTIAPRVSIESVIEKNPDVIIAGMTKDRQLWLKEWDKWKLIKAVKNRHVYPIDASLVIRQTPRILQGTRKMCEILNEVRKNNSKK